MRQSSQSCDFTCVRSARIARRRAFPAPRRCGATSRGNGLGSRRFRAGKCWPPRCRSACEFALAHAGLGSQVVDLAGDVEIDPLSFQHRETIWVGPLGRHMGMMAIAPQGVALGWVNGRAFGPESYCQEFSPRPLLGNLNHRLFILVGLFPQRIVVGKIYQELSSCFEQGREFLTSCLNPANPSPSAAPACNAR